MNDVFVRDCVTPNCITGAEQVVNNVSVLATLGPIVQPFIKMLEMISKDPVLHGVCAWQINCLSQRFPSTL